MPLVKILGFQFTVPTPYHAGHCCTASEADLLNRMLVRGISKGLYKVLSTTIDHNIDPGGLSEDAKSNVRAAGEEYVRDYALGFSAGHDHQRSVRIEADRIARGILESRLYAQGQSTRDLDAHTLAEELATIASSDKVRTEAERRVNVTQEIANKAHDELLGASTGDE